MAQQAKSSGTCPGTRITIEHLPEAITEETVRKRVLPANLHIRAVKIAPGQTRGSTATVCLTFPNEADSVVEKMGGKPKRIDGKDYVLKMKKLTGSHPYSPTHVKSYQEFQSQNKTSDPPQPSNPDLYRTSICDRWLKGGCTYGDLCFFAHGPSELREKSRSSTANYGPVLYIGFLPAVFQEADVVEFLQPYAPLLTEQDIRLNNPSGGFRKASVRMPSSESVEKAIAELHYKEHTRQGQNFAPCLSDQKELKDQKVYIGYLPADVQEADIVKLLRRYVPQISDGHVKIHIPTKDIGFRSASVRMPSTECVEKVIAKLHDKEQMIQGQRCAPSFKDAIAPNTNDPKIFIGDLPGEAQEADVVRLLRPFAPRLTEGHVKLGKLAPKGGSRSASVRMPSIESIEQAVAELHKKEYTIQEEVCWPLVCEHSTKMAMDREWNEQRSNIEGTNAEGNSRRYDKNFNIFIGDLPEDTRLTDVVRLLLPYAPETAVRHVRMGEELYKGVYRGAWTSMPSKEAVFKALEGLNGKGETIQGQPCTLFVKAGEEALRDDSPPPEAPSPAPSEERWPTPPKKMPKEAKAKPTGSPKPKSPTPPPAPSEERLPTPPKKMPKENAAKPTGSPKAKSPTPPPDPSEETLSAPPKKTKAKSTGSSKPEIPTLPAAIPDTIEPAGWAGPSSVVVPPQIDMSTKYLQMSVQLLAANPNVAQIIAESLRAQSREIVELSTLNQQIEFIMKKPTMEPMHAQFYYEQFKGVVAKHQVDQCVGNSLLFPSSSFGSTSTTSSLPRPILHPNPDQGPSTDQISVEIKTDAQFPKGTRLFYTLSHPDFPIFPTSSSPEYLGDEPILLCAAGVTEVRCVAICDGQSSDVVTGKYCIKASPPFRILPTAGRILPFSFIWIDFDEVPQHRGIFYTLDGSVPSPYTAKTFQYTKPFTLQSHGIDPNYQGPIVVRAVMVRSRLEEVWEMAIVQYEVIPSTDTFTYDNVALWVIGGREYDVEERCLLHDDHNCAMDADIAEGKVHVYKGLMDRKDPENAQIVAIKHMEKIDLSHGVQAIKEELSKLVQLPRHDRIIKYHDFCINDSLGSADIVMDFGGISLRQVLNDIKIDGTSRMPLDDIREYARQIAEGLSWLNSKGLAHKSLKPENILIKTLSGGLKSVKLVDFQLSRSLSLMSSGSFDPTLMPYLPPEFMTTEYFDEEEEDEGSIPNDNNFDVWSLGIICIELFTGSQPSCFSRYGNNLDTLALFIKQVRFAVLTKDIKEILPKDFADFLKRCLSPVDQRLTSDKLLTDVFLSL